MPRIPRSCWSSPASTARTRVASRWTASFCIHCGLCVRYCAEVKKLDAVGLHRPRHQQGNRLRSGHRYRKVQRLQGVLSALPDVVSAGGVRAARGANERVAMRGLTIGIVAIVIVSFAGCSSGGDSGGSGGSVSGWRVAAGATGGAAGTTGGTAGSTGGTAGRPVARAGHRGLDGRHRGHVVRGKRRRCRQRRRGCIWRQRWGWRSGLRPDRKQPSFRRVLQRQCRVHVRPVFLVRRRNTGLHTDVQRERRLPRRKPRSEVQRPEGLSDVMTFRFDPTFPACNRASIWLGHASAIDATRRALSRSRPRSRLAPRPSARRWRPMTEFCRRPRRRRPATKAKRARRSRRGQPPAQGRTGDGVLSC